MKRLHFGIAAIFGLVLGLAACGGGDGGSGTAVIPQTAQVNDTGTVATTIVYADSSKATVVGTSTTTYALLPDTSATALLKIVETSKNQDGSMAGMAVSTYRMTPAGALTHLTEEMTAGTVTLTLTF
jgi:hypothetical protein